MTCNEPQLRHRGFGRASAISLIALLASLSGCGASGPPIAGVEGTVTMDGKPLPLAAVVFVPENGRPAGATTDDAGHYVLTFSEGRKGALLGKAKVLITTKRDPRMDSDGKPQPSSPEIVPMKYNARTGLQFVVEDGKQNIADFHLDSKGPVSKSVEVLDAELKPFGT